MPTNTTTYSFQKPVVGADEDSWGGYLNSNWDKVDDLFDGTTAITGIDINSGTIDGTVIGGSSAAAGTFTTLTATTSATLQHSASTKLATTATGVDITGTLTSDGLTVDGNVALNGGTSATIISADANRTGAGFQISGLLGKWNGTNAANIGIYTGSDTSNKDDGIVKIQTSEFLGTLRDRLLVANNGDISFYEDTGTTAKFFWDASAEKLLIGDTSNSTASGLYIKTADPTDLITGQLVLKGTALTGAADTGASIVFEGFNGSGNRTLGSIQSLKENSTFGDSLAYMRFSTFGSSGTQERMRITSAGSVGIGTSSPSRKLHINSGTTDTAVLIESTDAVSIINMKDSTSTGDGISFGVNGDAFIVNSGLSTERMRIDSSGRVGIGTSSPSAALHVDSSNDGPIFDSGGTGNTNHALLVRDSGNNQLLRVNNNGNVGIGTSSTDGRLKISAPSGGGYAAELTLYGNNGAVYGYGNVVRSKIASQSAGDAYGANLLFYTNDSSNAYQERMRISSSGSVGIGTSSPLTGLYSTVGHISGTSGGLILSSSASTFGIGSVAGVLQFYDSTNAAERMRIDSSGALLVGTTSSILSAVNRGNITLSGVSESIFNLGVGGSQGGYLYQTSANLDVWNTKNGYLRFGTNNLERMRIDSSGNVGIGTSSPEGQLHLYGDSVGAPSADADDLVIEKTGDTGLSILSTTTGRIYFGDAASNDQGSIRYVHSDNSMRFETDSAERMRLDSSGNLLVGNTNTSLYNNSADAYGFVIGSSGTYQQSANNTVLAYFNRQNGDGEIIQFRKDGATVGSIGVGNSSSVFDISGAATFPIRLTGQNVSYWVTSGAFYAGTDNARDLGTASFRWDDVYATNGTIQTSDANEKQDIDVLSDAEQRVALAAKGLLRKFRWKDAVAEKGDDARIHFGIIAQDLQAAFAAEGLDAGDYAMFIHTTWTDEETGEEKSRMGVRYSELLAFIIAAI
jgi:hypothetical protein